MRITKEKAELVAKKLTEKKQKEKQVLEENLQEFCYNIALSKIPKPVMDMFKEYPRYVNSSSEIFVIGEGIDNYNLKYQSISNPLPKAKESIPVTKTESNKIQKLSDKITNLKSEIRTLKKEIETAVYNLKTYSRVEKEFPEAFKYLPKEQITTALQVNISDIRNKLKH